MGGLHSWMPTDVASKFLNVSVSNMHEMKRVGILKPGEHYYATGLGISGPKMWDVLAVRRTLLEETARRENLQRQHAEEIETYTQDGDCRIGSELECLKAQLGRGKENKA
jgi:hypothetical protein